MRLAPSRARSPKIKGCRTIGIAGGPEKCTYIVKELGFDASIDYKSEDVKTALAQHCPKGVDVYFDNVGGEILDSVLLFLNRRARVVICGAISQYNNTTPDQRPVELPFAAGKPRENGGIRRFRLRCPVREGLRDLAGLVLERQAQIARAHGERPRDLPGNLAQALQRREFRQAHPAGG